MTTIACRRDLDGRFVVCADSWEIVESEDGGATVELCEKLFRRQRLEERKPVEVIIATAGESGPGMLFVDWYASGKPEPPDLADTEFDVLILRPDGLFKADQHCQPVKVLEPYTAIGTGRKHALTAMDCGLSAFEAVMMAARRDPYTGGGIVSMSLNEK